MAQRGRENVITQASKPIYFKVYIVINFTSGG